MSKCALIIDPLPTQRRRFSDALSQRMLAYGIANGTDLPRGEVFDVYWVALRQATGHGLQMGRELRQKFPSAVIIVYGKPDGRGTPPRGKVEELWGVNLFIPFVPDAADAVLIVRSCLKGEPLELRPSLSRSGGGTVGPLPGGRPVVMPEPSRAVAAESDEDEPTWSELLSAPISGDTLRQILRKDLFGRKEKPAGEGRSLR